MPNPHTFTNLYDDVKIYMVTEFGQTSIALN